MLFGAVAELKAISTLCSRCGVEETDTHLFFTCPFAQAAWFSFPWFIRSEQLTINCNSLSQILVNFLSMNHPHATLENILTFMWCLWKSRNDNLFSRKPGAPHQVHQAARAIQQNLEKLDLFVMSPLLVGANTEHGNANVPAISSVTCLPPQGSTIESDMHIQGAKIFSDALDNWR